MVIVVVGDGTQILNGLKALGTVRIVNAEGTAMTEADLTPRASAVSFAASRISAGSARYRVLVQGNALGTENRLYHRAQEGGRDVWHIITATEIASFVRQYDTTTIDATTLAPIQVRQSGTQMGNNMFVRLDYAAGRVRGQARTLDQSGPRDITVDTTVAAGVIDENELPAIFLALPYAAGAHWNLAVFSGGKGAVVTASATVVGEESVTVPAGTIACWKVDLTGLDQAVTFYVSKENPVLVKLEFQGQPVSFELTGRN